MLEIRFSMGVLGEMTRSSRLPLQCVGVLTCWVRLSSFRVVNKVELIEAAFSGKLKSPHRTNGILERLLNSMNETN